MPLFIKSERFTQKTMKLLPEERQKYIDDHYSWVKAIKSSGKKIASGYLCNEWKIPGGGGLLVIEAESYKEAKYIVEKDPMIIGNLVTWKLWEWIPVLGSLLD